MLALGTENRQGAGVAGGDEVDAEIELDTETRELTPSLPPRLAAAPDEPERGARPPLRDGRERLHRRPASPRLGGPTTARLPPSMGFRGLSGSSGGRGFATASGTSLS
jgi:hypothetical protein